VLYISNRIFSVREEKLLEGFFPKEYAAYRGKVLLPWL
jgi:protein-S-isoprenylcysteine O-methyltransferase Ste14